MRDSVAFRPNNARERPTGGLLDVEHRRMSGAAWRAIIGAPFLFFSAAGSGPAVGAEHTSGAVSEKVQLLTVSDAPQRCAALAGSHVPAAAFALPTRGADIKEAVIEGGGNNSQMSQYCRLRGAIYAASPSEPSILFQVNLPTTWNHVTVQFGGGGSDGVLIEATGYPPGAGPPDPTPLAQGYATYGTDSGHQGGGFGFVTNAHAFANYSHEAIKRAKDLAAALVLSYYAAPAWHNYHIGGSKGGQEALQAAQRYYRDFDGVVAFYPAAQYESLGLGYNRLFQIGMLAPAAALSTSQQAYLRNVILDRCDAIDGVRDGIVSRPGACRAKLKLQELLCPSGMARPNTCLTAPQITALEEASTPFTFAYPMPNDVTSVGPWPVLNGADLRIWMGDGTPGSQAPYFNPPYARIEAVASARITPEMWAKDIMGTTPVYDASSPDLDGFRKRGGKLIMLHGTVDMLVPLSMTANYFERLSSRYGSSTSQFVRLYVVPGYGHGEGDFLVRWDALAALNHWVQAEVAPVMPVATDGSAGGRRRTRPLCRYGWWPSYNGRGSQDDAANFSCARETGSPP